MSYQPPTVTIIRPGSIDRFGDPTAATEIPVAGCKVWPAGSTEVEGQQDTVTYDVSVLMPAGTDVKATDQIRIGDPATGDLFDIVGRPQVFTNVFTGTTPGVLVNLRQVTG